MYTYKYLPPDRHALFENGMLRFTQPADLNDPFECMPTITVGQTHEVAKTYFALEEQRLRGARARMKEMDAFRRRRRNAFAELKDDPNRLRDYFLQRAHENLNSQIGILSLSKRWDSALMWAHYCISHTGFCVGFDRQHRFFRGRLSNPGSELRDVKYSHQRIAVPLVKDVSIDFDVMFTKSLDWSYEVEERLLGSLSDAKVTIPKEPFPVHLLEVPLEAIKEVVIGARASIGLRNAILTFCRARKIGAFQATPSNVNFDMIREALD